ncbi:MAG: AsmA-like C-terminal region-containing protein, partial [Quisquiliibacterium sp.]
AEPVLQGDGLAVSLDSDLVDVDAWVPFLGDLGQQAGDRNLGKDYLPSNALQPQSVSMRTARLTVAGKELHDVVLGATRIGEFWNANIDSREVQGFFSWRSALPGQPIGTLTARFNKLEIPRSRVLEFENLLDAAPADLPALDILADNFVLFEHPLGQLELKATNSADPARPRWTLDLLKIRNPAASFEATGSWAPAAAGVRPTRLDFGMQLSDSGGMLGRFGLKDVMRGGPGKVSGQVYWQGSPISIDYPTLGGKLKLAIGKGQFLKSEPGISKLIGVLSLQSLPRRLTLDFSDVFAKGFSFDEITGDVEIAYGVAR